MKRPAVTPHVTTVVPVPLSSTAVATSAAGAVVSEVLVGAGLTDGMPDMRERADGVEEGVLMIMHGGGGGGRFRCTAFPAGMTRVLHEYDSCNVRRRRG